MPRSPTSAAAIQSRMLSLLCGVTVVAALYFGKEILLPFAIAVLLSFVLAPLADRLERLRVPQFLTKRITHGRADHWLELVRVPRAVAVVSIVALSLTAFASLSFVLLQQFYDLAYELPKYRDNIRTKVVAFQSKEGGLVDRVSGMVADMKQVLTPPKNDDSKQGAPSNGSPSEQLEGEAEAAAKDARELLTGRSAEAADEGRVDDENQADAAPPDPVPVTVVEQLTARDVAQGVLGPLVAPLGKVALVTVFVLFMLLAREDLRNRIIQLFGARQLNTTTQAIDDAAHRVSRYLLMQLIINICYGAVIAVGLFFIGLPNALLWGALTTILRFVPFVGPWIAAVMPVMLSLAVFPGWSRPLMVVALFIVNELVSNNVFEPWLYGTSTGISTFGIIVSATFWTWLWGPVGLILATPLTVCLTVLGRYVPQLSFLNTLIGDDDVLPPASRLYQRLLALDPEEALEVTEEYFEDHTLEELYDEVLLPALSLAEQDRHRDELDDHKERFILRTIRELVEDLDVKARDTEETSDAEGDGQEGTALTPKVPITCLPARDEADEIVGLMLAKLLAARGTTMKVLPTAALASEMLEKLSQESTKIVCVSALPPHAATHARYLCKRLRPRFAELKIVVGLWETGGTSTKPQERLKATGIDSLVTTLTMAADHLDHMASAQRTVQQSA